MILILAEKGDGHTRIVTDLLRHRGAEFTQFDTSEFPGNVCIEFGFGDPKEGVLSDRQTLRIADDCINLDEVGVIWNRRPRPPRVSEALSSADGEFARGESFHVLRSLFYLLRDRFWVNPYDAQRSAELKPYQLRMAREVGFEVPRTLITNDPSQVRIFFDRCGGKMIYKPFGAYCVSEGSDGRKLGLYTNCVSQADLSKRLTEISLAPCIFQEYVPKDLELRVTVIDSCIFTAAIDSQRSDLSKHDWRRFDIPNTPYTARDVPRPVAQKIRALIERLGLVFGCLDFVLTPDGRYVFLEVNPSGQWYWIEELTGLRMAEAFTDMLIQKDRDARPRYQTA